MPNNTGTMVDVGLAHLAKALAETADPTYFIAYGTGTTASTALDTKLETEVQRLQATTVSRTNQTLTLKVTFTNSSGDDVVPSEVGVFTALTGGILIYRGDIISGCRRTVADGETWEPTIYLVGANGSF